MRILVTGKNGQVAQALNALNSETIEILTLGRPELDICDKTSIAGAVKAFKPDVIVNAAAYTAVDKAEEEPSVVFAVNRDGAKNVADIAAEHGLPIIQISTDYVFNGEKDTPYTEDDPVGPINVYGLSKLEGEWRVAAANPNHVILRTAWVYSTYGNNFIKTMLRLAETRSEISVVCDQWGTPTSADFIAENIIEIASQILSPTPPENWRGIFHMVPDGKTNWAEFAERIFECISSNMQTLVTVKRISSKDYRTYAKRPQDSLISNQRLKQTYSFQFFDWLYYVNSFMKKISL